MSEQDRRQGAAGPTCRNAADQNAPSDTIHPCRLSSLMPFGRSALAQPPAGLNAVQIQASGTPAPEPPWTWRHLLLRRLDRPPPHHVGGRRPGGVGSLRDLNVHACRHAFGPPAPLHRAPRAWPGRALGAERRGRRAIRPSPCAKGRAGGGQGEERRRRGAGRRAGAGRGRRRTQGISRRPAAAARRAPAGRSHHARRRRRPRPRPSRRGAAPAPCPRLVPRGPRSRRGALLRRCGAVWGPSRT